MNRDTKNKSDDVQDDAALISAFLSGNRVSFDKLVLRHQDRVFSLCLRFLGNYEEAEDSTQDIFIKVYNSLKRFRFKSSFYTWLYRIAVNTCKNRIKSREYRHMKKSTQLNNPEKTGDGLQAMEPRNETNNPLAELERKERMRLIQDAIDSLPTEQKTVLILRDIEGLSYEEITIITGNRLGTIKSRLSRARFGLKERLGGII